MEDMVEEEKSELNEVLEDIAYTESEDGLKELWREEVAKIYWLRGQLPPKNWEELWPNIKKQLEDKDE